MENNQLFCKSENEETKVEQNEFQANARGMTFTESHVMKKTIPKFVDGFVRKCFIAWKKSFSDSPKTFFYLTYNLIISSPDEYWKIITKIIDMKDENGSRNALIFKELNLILNCQNLKLLNQSKIFIKLMQSFRFENNEEKMNAIQKMQTLAKSLAFKILKEMDENDYYFQYLLVNDKIPNFSTPDNQKLIKELGYALKI